MWSYEYQDAGYKYKIGTYDAHDKRSVEDPPLQYSSLLLRGGLMLSMSLIARSS